MTVEISPVKISGVGKYLPEKTITNADLEKLVDTSDEWITSRSGIKERRVVSDNETASDLATGAGVQALEFAGVAPEEVDLIICATSIPDNLYPSVACEVQSKLGAKKAAAFDITAACSGFIYGMSIARSFIQSGTYKNVLLVAVDIHSRFVDWKDRSTCVLFGDGAGALLLSKSDDKEDDIIQISLEADGSGAKELKIPLSGKNCPLVVPNECESSFVSMNGREIYKFAVNTVPDSIQKILNSTDIELKDIDNFILHQANIRIIEAIADKVGMDKNKFFSNLQKYGNTSAASIPIALTEAVEQNIIKSQSMIVLSGFGAGLTWGTAIVKWRAKDKRKS